MYTAPNKQCKCLNNACSGKLNLAELEVAGDKLVYCNSSKKRHVHYSAGPGYYKNGIHGKKHKIVLIEVVEKSTVPSDAEVLTVVDETDAARKEEVSPKGKETLLAPTDFSGSAKASTTSEGGLELFISPPREKAVADKDRLVLSESEKRPEALSDDDVLTLVDGAGAPRAKVVTPLSLPDTPFLSTVKAESITVLGEGRAAVFTKPARAEGFLSLAEGALPFTKLDFNISEFITRHKDAKASDDLLWALLFIWLPLAYYYLKDEEKIKPVESLVIEGPDDFLGLTNFFKQKYSLTTTSYIRLKKILIEMAGERDKLTPDQAKTFVQIIENHDLNLSSVTELRKQRSKLARCLLIPVGHTAKGLLRKAYPEELRPYRSFSHDREKQIIKQVATQLYYYIRPIFVGLNKLKLEEIQILNIEIAGRRNLFIAANNWKESAGIKEAINQAGWSWERVLTTAHKANSGEEDSRTHRYAKKLSSRVFNKDYSWDGANDDAVMARQLGEIIRLGNIIEIDFDLSSPETKLAQALLVGENNIYILSPSADYIGKHRPNDMRHTEEYLIDIVKFARDILKLSISSYIGGKKRPCTTCAASMKDNITRFGARPGRVWLHGFQNQELTEARNSLIFFANPSYISLTNPSKGEVKADAGHDSGSDSEPE